MGLENLLVSVFESGSNESFQGYGGGANVSKSSPSSGSILLAFIIIEIFVLIFGKYLWNNIATKLIPQLRPVKNIWQILGLSILLKLLFH
jgi:hypothetical protein